MTPVFSFPKAKSQGQTWEQTLSQIPEWQKLPRQQRSALLARARKRDKSERLSQQILESVSQPLEQPPEETPFFIPEGMTAEEATIEKVRRDAEAWPVLAIEHGKPSGHRSPAAQQPLEQKTGEPIFRGPRGGRYRIDKKGRKQYDIA